MTSALCALRHVDNHILYTLAQQQSLQKSPLFVSSCLQGVHWGRGGGAIRWYEKKYKLCVRRLILSDKAFINGLLVNCLKVR